MKTTDRQALKKALTASQKKPAKITLKLGSKDKARQKERDRIRAAAEERERRREEAKAKAAKLKAKEERKAKAEARAQAEAEAEEARQEAKRAKKAAKKAEAEAAKAREAEKASVQIKAESHEPSQTPVGGEPSATHVAANGEPSQSKEPSAPRVARDAPMQNGEDINVPGLPVGIMIPARKKGPGRPPKDGVMSKRERAMLIKQNKEREKAIKMGMDPSLIPPPDIRPPKPKIPRRNSQGEEIDDPDDNTPRAPRPPRSPSPEMKLEDYSEEQLQRPSANYVYLIYEAIKNCKAGVMNLQQIYSAIERRYPWYKFRSGSNGWQSSVRHNLGQHEVSIRIHARMVGEHELTQAIGVQESRERRQGMAVGHQGRCTHRARTQEEISAAATASWTVWLWPSSVSAALWWEWPRSISSIPTWSARTISASAATHAEWTIPTDLPQWCARLWSDAAQRCNDYWWSPATASFTSQQQSAAL
jgi:hypothetical protein